MLCQRQFKCSRLNRLCTFLIFKKGSTAFILTIIVRCFSMLGTRGWYFIRVKDMMATFRQSLFKGVFTYRTSQCDFFRLCAGIAYCPGIRTRMFSPLSIQRQISCNRHCYKIKLCSAFFLGKPTLEAFPFRPGRRPNVEICRIIRVVVYYGFKEQHGSVIAFNFILCLCVRKRRHQ